MLQEPNHAIRSPTSNAQLSTGPRTPEGKARSSQNALKHGLNARDLVIRAEEFEEFDLLRSSLEADLQPQGALEHDLFGQLVHASWNLRRVRRLESDLACGPQDRLADDSCEKAFNRFARHHARFERSYFRCLRELRVLQTNRALRDQLQLVIPALASIREMSKRTRTTSSISSLPHRRPQPNSVEDKLEGTVRLPAELRPDGDQDNLPLSVPRLDHGFLAEHGALAGDPARS